MLPYVGTLGADLGAGWDARLPLQADRRGGGGDGGGGGGGGYPGHGGVTEGGGEGGQLEVQSVGGDQRHRDQGLERLEGEMVGRVPHTTHTSNTGRVDKERCGGRPGAVEAGEAGEAAQHDRLVDSSL